MVGILCGVVGISVELSHLVQTGGLNLMIQIFCGNCPANLSISPASYREKIHLLAKE